MYVFIAASSRDVLLNNLMKKTIKNESRSEDQEKTIAVQLTVNSQGRAVGILAWGIAGPALVLAAVPWLCALNLQRAHALSHLVHGVAQKFRDRLAVEPPFDADGQVTDQHYAGQLHGLAGKNRLVPEIKGSDAWMNWKLPGSQILLKARTSEKKFFLLLIIKSWEVDKTNEANRRNDLGEKNMRNLQNTKSI